jgi:hypothetical protein
MENNLNKQTLLKLLIRASIATGFMLSAGLASACTGVTIAGVCFHVTTIPLPGFDGQLANANDLGTAIGNYSTSNAFIHPQSGFILPKGGSVETVNEPDATSPIPLTQLGGINDSNKIVGFYNDSSSRLRGFVLTGGVAGTYMTYDYFAPTVSGTGTVLRGINNSGNMVGETIGLSTGDVGFLVEGATTTSFNYLGMRTNPVSVNDFHEIVGIAGTSPVTGFYRSPAGAMSAIHFPGSTSTIAASINDFGIVGGNYIDSSATPKSHGYVFVHAFNEYFSFDIPGSTSTNVASVTNSLQIWGNYSAGGVFYGYVLTPSLF